MLIESSSSVARATVGESKGVENREPMNAKRQTGHESHGGNRSNSRRGDGNYQ